MVAPVFATAGAVVVSQTSPVSVPYPSGIVAGDLLLLQTTGEKFFSADPSGWTGIGYSAMPSSRHHYVFAKIAVGTESGSLSLTPSAAGGANAILAQMYRISNPKQTGYTESFGDASHATSSALTAAAITTLGASRLAVALGARGSDGFTSGDNWTGETGGTWVLRAQGANGLGSNYGLALWTAAMPAAGTISGGSAVAIDSVNGFWHTRSLAVLGLPNASSAQAIVIG